MGLVREVALAGLVLAGFDDAFQRRRVNQQLKMTKQEVKEDFRQHEGDPLLKGQIRKKQRALSRLRMMAAMAKADVVVMNPTHVAVALRYEPGSGQAPRVVAKGADLLAARDLDDLILIERYHGVARLLAFAFTLPDVVRHSGRVHRRPVWVMVGSTSSAIVGTGRLSRSRRRNQPTYAHTLMEHSSMTVTMDVSGHRRRDPFEQVRGQLEALWHDRGTEGAPVEGLKGKGH